MEYFFFYLLAINTAAFCLCWFDKRQAVRHRYRVPEKRLLLFSAMGGAFGFYLSMRVFRHKTKHMRFSLGVPLLCVLWGGLIAFLLLGQPRLF